MQKIHDIHSATALLHWDDEVNAPDKGAQFRAQQMATLSAVAHELMIDARLGDLLRELQQQKAQLTEDEAANVQLSWEDYEQATRLPVDFVKQLSKARSNAYHAWIKARRENDFEHFKQPLTELVALKRQQAELVGYTGHPYNAMLDDYEKGARVEDLDGLFKDVREQLVAFAKEIRERGTKTDTSFLHTHYPKNTQWELGLELLKQMGYDFEAGRQDVSEHPFTTTFSPGDVRVTTRIAENDPMNMVATCIHEGGHALYEQGLPTEQYGLPLGAATSLGIHESQSRLWENNVGLSLQYWRANWDKMQQRFPEQLKGITLEHFHQAINQVQPNLVRTEADELHYHLHILVRYELEKGLMDGSIAVADLKDAWNAKYKDFLGIEVTSDVKGVLQDIHWAEGLLGYFPTYSLGSFYAAQFFAKAQLEIPSLPDSIEKGDMKPLLDWLRHNIHQYGRKYTSRQLCERITGEPLNLRFFMEHARKKYSAVYQLESALV